MKAKPPSRAIGAAGEGRRRGLALAVSAAAHVAVLGLLVRGHEQRVAGGERGRADVRTIELRAIEPWTLRQPAARADGGGGAVADGGGAVTAMAVMETSARPRAIQARRATPRPARLPVAGSESGSGSGSALPPPRNPGGGPSPASPLPALGSGSGSGTGSALPPPRNPGGGPSPASPLPALGSGSGSGYLALASAPPPLAPPSGFSRARPARLIWPVRRGDEHEGALFVARVRVDRDGVVVGARLAVGPPRQHESDAVSAVWRFRYQPALDDDGTPIASWVEQSFIVRR